MSSYMAYISRMKHIYRWGLKRNIALENDLEHSYMVTAIAHMLAVITNTRYAGTLDCGQVALLAMYHDAPEVLTGDLPTPVKYFDPEIRTAYARVEELAREKLVELLPADLREAFAGILKPDMAAEEWGLVKAADHIAAYLKCAEEIKLGNLEFIHALADTKSRVENSPYPAVADFMREFAPSFGMTVDEMRLT
jgi:5'-deoxynucleotidase